VRRALLPVVLAALAVAGCGSPDRGDAAQPSALLPSMMPAAQTNADASPPPVPYDSATARVVVRASATWPHDSTAYTQGLVLDGDRLLESTGLEGHSQLRELDRRTGRVLRSADLPASVFGEGLAAVDGRLYQLTWRAGRGYTWDARSLALVDSVSYRGEGWGLASSGPRLLFSDGSSVLRVIDPAGFHQVDSLRVTEAGHDVWMLNELEMVGGELWANIYETDLIARIDPLTGRVTGWVDVSRLLTPAERASVEHRGGTANGIAWDAARQRVLLTGKLWPHVYEVDVAQLRPALVKAR